MSRFPFFHGFRWGILVLSGVVPALWPADAAAHVKWFSEFSFADRPLELAQVLTPTLWAMVALSVVVISALLMAEERVGRIPWVARLDGWLQGKSDNSVGVMRIGVGATLVWSWQAGNLLAPDLAISSEAILWLQFVVAILLIFRRTVRLAGAGVILLFILAITQFGIFRMLDYLLFVGAGWFFIAKNSKKPGIEATALPALYATVGFCLIWLGIEKLVYPSWAKVLLEQHPVLALGLPHDFFVVAAAFIEISLGFMIMFCLQERLLALTITLVFFLTTLVFGRAEVVGHTVIHAVLIVFLIAGAGRASPPSRWISSLKLKVPLTAIGFVGLLGLCLMPYVYGAKIQFEDARLAEAEEMAHHASREIDAEAKLAPPELSIAVHSDPVSGWNLELFTDNFTFAPGSAGFQPKLGEGHAHLYIDGRKVARIYGNWYHIPKLPPGIHEVVVTLNTNDHATLTIDGEPVEAATRIEVLETPREIEE